MTPCAGCVVAMSLTMSLVTSLYCVVSVRVFSVRAAHILLLLHTHNAPLHAPTHVATPHLPQTVPATMHLHAVHDVDVTLRTIRMRVSTTSRPQAAAGHVVCVCDVSRITTCVIFFYTRMKTQTKRPR